MGRPVGADEACAVHGKTHRQPLDGDVVHHLIVGALQERRVDRGKWLEAFGRKSCGEGDAVLLGDADIEGPVGKLFLEQIDAGARRHGGRDGDDLVVLARLFDQAFAIDLLEGRGRRLGLDLRASRDVELDHAVVLVGGFFRRLVPFALLRHDMNEDRPVLHVAHVLQHRQQVVDIVAVDRPDIEEAEFIEQRAAGHQAARVFLHGERALLQRLARNVLGDLAQDLPHAVIAASGDAPGQVGGQRADRRRNRHVVVVEHDDQPRIHRAGIVHRLVGHAGRHRAVADHGDDVVVLVLQVARHCHAERSRNRGRGMRCAERVVLAFGALGEAGQAAALAQGADTVTAAGQDLVRIGLMADVPDQPVPRGIEHIVQRHSQLDDAEAGAKMAAGRGDGIDCLLAQFVGDLAQLALIEAAEIVGSFDNIEQRS